MSDDSGRPDLILVAQDRITDRQPDVILGAGDPGEGPPPEPRAYVLGLYNAPDVHWAESQAEQLALPALEGDLAVRTDEDKTYIKKASALGTMADWELWTVSTLIATPFDLALSVNGQSGDVVLAAADVGAISSTAGVLKSRLAPNVKDYGAVGDGTTDDSTAFANAIAAGRGAIEAPDGTYLIGNVAVTSNLTVQGLGPKSIIKLKPNQSAFVGTSLSDITFRGLKFVGNGGSTDTGSGAELTGCTRILVHGCHFTGMATGAGTGGAGVVFNNCSHVRFIGNSGIDAGYTLANFFNSQSFAAVGNVHKNTRGAASTLLSTCCYANSGSIDGVFASNVSDSDTYPIEVRKGTKRIAVVGNIIKNCGQQGVVVQSEPTGGLTSHVTVADNVIEMATGALYGINIDSTTHCTARGNIVQGPTTGAGIQVTRAGSGTNGTDNTVTDNLVRGSDDAGILIYASCDRTRVTGNRVESTLDNRGIFVQANDCDVLNNYVYDAGFHGIDVTGANAQIIGNRVNATRNSGIGIQAAAGCRVAENFVTSTSGSPYNVALPTVASAATVTLPLHTGVVRVTGTTNVTSVTPTFAGDRVTLIFAGILTFTDGSNLKLAGNLVTTADDTITLACDGTNWFEVTRSVN